MVSNPKMSIEPLLTVLLITYNHKDYIEKSITSVLEQKTDFNFIIRIIDDCSNDGTSDLIKNYTNQHPKIIQHVLREKNLGVVDNIYQGLKSINTPYFAELEGDDYWCDENKLQIAVDILEQNKDCVMFAHNTKILKAGRYEGDVIDSKSNEVNAKFKLEQNTLPVYLHFSSRVYRNVFDFNTIDKHIVAFDIGIYYLYLEKGFCYYYDKTMSVYNTNDKSFYFTKTFSQREEIDFLVLQKLSAYLNYKYNKIFVNMFLNQNLFKNIEEIYGQKKVWDLYINMKKIFKKTYKPMHHRIFFKVKSIINRLRNKLRIRARLSRLINIILPRREVNTDLLIFDDFFPHPLSPFRYTEYGEYLKNFKKIKIISDGQSLMWCKDGSSLSSVIDKYLDKFPLFKSKIEEYNFATSYNAKLVYVTFLGNVVHHDLGYSLKVPFIVNLYPGGMLQINDKVIDSHLKKYLGSPYCKKVIVTQNYVYDYLLKNKLCPKEKIEFIFGVVTPFELLDMKIEKKERYGFQKNVLDICFVSHKYTNDGRDKGYDKFIESAGILAKKYNNIRFHVIGQFSIDDIYIGDIKEKIKFYGTRSTEWFKEFYKDKDIIISPNIPFVLNPGGFDGFPTASVTEAGLNGLAMFATDELNMNENKFIDGEEIVIIQPNSKSIVEKIDFYLKNPDKLKSISELGALKIKDLYSYEKQIKKRISIIQNELDNLS